MTIEELLEIEEIKQLRIKYGHFYDAGDIDSLMELFCDDGVAEFGEEYGGDWEGIDAIRRGYTEWGKKETSFTFLHSVTNPWIRLLSDTEANGRWYLLHLNFVEKPENPLKLFGIYDDAYRKVDGQWRIARTRIDFLWPERKLFGYRVAAE